MYATTIIFQKAFNIHNYGNIKLFREIPWFLTLFYYLPNGDSDIFQSCWKHHVAG